MAMAMSPEALVIAMDHVETDDGGVHNQFSSTCQNNNHKLLDRRFSHAADG